MSYEIERHQTCVVVRLIGHVCAADLLKSHEEQAFLEGMEDTATAIYDYSNAESVSISAREAEMLAKLAEHVAHFQSPIHIIIVPRCASTPQLAQTYCETITSANVYASVAATITEALQHADNIH